MQYKLIGCLLNIFVRLTQPTTTTKTYASRSNTRTKINRKNTSASEQIVLVENFIDSLSEQNEDYHLTLAATKLSEPTLQKIRDNPVIR